MTDRIISFDLAKLAKVKGFPQSITPEEYIRNLDDNIKMYYPDGKVRGYWFNPYDYERWRAASPTVLQEWLLEEHNIQVYVCSRTKDGEGKYRDFVAYVDNEAVNDPRNEEFKTHFAALDFGLRVALERLKDAGNKNN